MKTPRALLLALSAALILSAPAQAVVVRGPAAAASWGASVAQVAGALQARPNQAGASPLLYQVSGRLRQELTLRPGSEAALAFTKHLPVDARSFAVLSEDMKILALDLAVTAAAAELQGRAEAALADPAPAASELDFVAQRWFYLAPETAKAVKDAVAARQAAQTMGFAEGVAKSLSKQDKKDKALARAEAAAAVNVAARLLDEAPAGKRVEHVLAPYVARALDEAEARARERGVPPGKVYRSVIDDHTNLFGKDRDKALFKALRKSGEWTEFVAAVSLHAAERLGAMGEEARHALALMAETDELRLAIPAWHPLFGKYASIAEWLAKVHGAPDDAKDHKGVGLGRLFGIPIRLLYSAIPAIALYTVQFALTYFGKADVSATLAVHLLQGAAATILLYASVLAHELGHALAAKAFGIRTRRIIFNLLGGGAEVVRGFRQSLPEFVIALAGPVVSALCGVAAFYAAPLAAGTMLFPILKVVASMNLTLAAFNLLPLFPMDGGRVLRALLTKWLGSYKATKATAYLGLALSALAGMRGFWLLMSGQLGLGIGLILGGAFFVYGSLAMSVHPGTITVDEKKR